MMMVYVRDVRPKPFDLAAMTEKERADLFRTVVAYAGTYDFDGKAITHHLDVSSNQAWTGTDQVRKVSLDGRRLVQTTDPHPFSADGKMSITNFTWANWIQPPSRPTNSLEHGDS
jgi:hypothetical protein